MKRTAALAALVTVLALAGCSTPTTSSAPSAAPGGISDACRAALEEMAAAPEDVSADDWAALGAASVQACPTVDEYLAGAREVPNALWYSDSPVDDKIVITTACLIDNTTPLCVDAAAKGYDVGS